MAILKQMFGSVSRPGHPIFSGTTIIGRDDDCEIVVASPAVSRNHARITMENNRYFIDDLSSRNGTTVNGQTVTQKTLLTDGDRVEIAARPFRFCLQESLDESSGSWGVKPKVISVTDAGNDADGSVRRQVVTRGDRISSETLGTDSLREGRIAARILVGDGGAAWPVTSKAVQKLNHTLQLVHALRRTARIDDVIANVLQVYFDIFHAAERVAVLMRDDQATGICVAAAASRHEVEEVEICLPLVRSAMQHSEGLLYMDHWTGSPSLQAEQPNGTLRSILVGPLAGLTGQSLGAIQLDTTDAQLPLSAADLEELVILNHIVSFAVEQVGICSGSDSELATGLDSETKDA